MKVVDRRIVDYRPDREHTCSNCDTLIGYSTPEVKQINKRNPDYEGATRPEFFIICPSCNSSEQVRRW